MCLLHVTAAPWTCTSVSFVDFQPKDAPTSWCLSGAGSAVREKREKVNVDSERMPSYVVFACGYKCPGWTPKLKALDQIEI